MQELIYGKSGVQGIVSIEVVGSEAHLFLRDGSVQKVPATHWILYTNKMSDKFQTLDGNLYYRYMIEYDDKSKYDAILESTRKKRLDHYTIRNDKESFMVKNGYSYYQGMKVKDVSVLSFDIETNGLAMDANSQVYLISNTFRDAQGNVTRKLFSVDEYESHEDMIWGWALWIRTINPSIILGHNILSYDLPFLDRCSSNGLMIGRNHEFMQFDEYSSEFRKDGSQTYTYTDCHIFGREIVDTMFLAIKYDVGRKYESYGLKAIIAHEGLEVKGRQFYDASQIKNNWHDPEEREKIKAYAMHDADDALALFDLMIPSFFYFAQSCPMPLQRIINKASGSQINAIMVRAYLQQGHSLPKASEAKEYEGAISIGNPGIYKHVYKVDVASLYPSIILDSEIYDKNKDPQGLFLKMVQYFTEQRLANKQLAKETGDRHYDDLSNAQKIVINSAYGFMGANRLLFNSPENAALVTRNGRQILQQAIDWSQAKGFKLVNADTDSISFTSGKKLDDFEGLIAELNSLYSDRIRWENDGYYKTVVVVKAKNYVLEDEKGNVKLKGSGLKATMKEKALQEFIKELIALLLKGRKDHIFALYEKYAIEAGNVTDMSRWVSKKTVTKSVLKPERTNEARVLEALEDSDVSEGDKVYMFFKTDEELCTLENFDGTYDKDKLYKKLYKTLEIFDSIIDIDCYPDLSLKRNAILIRSV